MVPDAKPSYGIDAPGVVGGFLLLTVVLALAGVFIGSGAGTPAAGLGPWIGALVCGATAAYMIFSSVRGKAKLWQRTLDDLKLAGDEDALDLGCGRGLVLIELARRLPRGHATGVDIWRNKDQSGNSRTMTELNVRMARVDGRVDIRDADMTNLPFDDRSFDLVTASLAIHNIAGTENRGVAVREAARVARPGGRIVLIDIAKTAEYAEILRELGCEEVQRSGRCLATYPPSRIVTARRPLDTNTDRRRS